MMNITPEMLNCTKIKEKTKQKISDNEVKLSDNQVMLADIRNERVRIESDHEEEMARIKAEENLALAKIEASNEQEISRIKAEFALTYKKMDDSKQLKLARIFERMLNTQIKSQDEKDITLANQVLQGLLAFADKEEETHEKNLEFIKEQINKYDEKIKNSTGHDKSDARRKLDEWNDKLETENKNFRKQQESLAESIKKSGQSFRGGNLTLPDLVTAISNSNSQFSATLGFNRIPEIKALETTNEEN